jgi:hypothetical protein
MNNNNNVLNTFLQFMKMGNNPQAIIQNAIQQNPNLQGILNQVQNSGLSTKEYVMQYARQNNIDLSPLIQMINNQGIKL